MASSLSSLALLSKYKDILSAYSFPDKNHLLNKETKEQELKDFSFTFVELPKFAKQLKKPMNELTLEEKFYYFLDKVPSMTPKYLKKK